MNSSRWLSRPARSGFISIAIDQDVGIFPVVAFSHGAVPSPGEHALEALPLLCLFFGLGCMLAVMISKFVLFVLLVTRLVRCISPNDLGSDLTILINNDLLGMSGFALF